MYKAIIQTVVMLQDEIIVHVDFIDGNDAFAKRYPFAHEGDLVNVFEQTIQTELKRINDLTTAFTALKEREGEEITYQEPK